jgi:SAM-dependent methyltransferase
MRALSNTSYEQLVHSNAESCGLGCWKAPPGLLRRVFRNTVHSLSHKFILDRRSTRSVRAGGFRLAIYPSVFHPKLFLTSEFFARFLASIDLKGKHVADVGTGSGILALAAARAGATVVALDINPMAVDAAADNARTNGLGDRVTAVRSDLMSALAPGFQFDVIISNPPFFSGEPRDIADRAWVAGPGYHVALRTGAQKAQAIGHNVRPSFLGFRPAFSRTADRESRISRADCDGFFDRDRIDDHLRIGPGGVECSNRSEYRSGRQQFRRLPRCERGS